MKYLIFDGKETSVVMETCFKYRKCMIINKTDENDLEKIRGLHDSFLCTFIPFSPLQRFRWK